MRILFDIVHPADVNFFKASIGLLLKSRHNVFVSFRDRGKLFKILSYEIENVPLLKLGTHRKSLAYKILSQLLRDIKMFQLVRSLKIDVVACFGSVSVIGARLAGARFVAFDDDYEYKLAFYHPNLLSNLHVFPDFIPVRNRKVRVYHGYKELAYLHNTVFLKNPQCNSSRPYCFIRIIGNVSLNYSKTLSTDWQEAYTVLMKLGIEPFVSVEIKQNEGFFRQIGYNVLEEPVKDFYSFLAGSQLVITMGDTVAREASLLAVPTYYYGLRDMVVNQEFLDLGILRKITLWSSLIDQLSCFHKDDFNGAIVAVQNKHRTWDNTTDVIFESITETATNKSVSANDLDNKY